MSAEKGAPLGCRFIWTGDAKPTRRCVTHEYDWRPPHEPICPGIPSDAGYFSDTFEADHAESMKDPEYAAAYREAEERSARLVQSPCSEGNCVVLTDPEDPEYDAGWGPVDCPCQDEVTRPLPPAETGADQ